MATIIKGKLSKPLNYKRSVRKIIKNEMEDSDNTPRPGTKRPFAVLVGVTIIPAKKTTVCTNIDMLETSKITTEIAQNIIDLILNKTINDYVHDTLQEVHDKMNNNRLAGSSLVSAAKLLPAVPNQYGQTYYVRTDGAFRRLVPIKNLTASEILNICVFGEAITSQMPSWVLANPIYVPSELNRLIMLNPGRTTHHQIEELLELPELPTLCPEELLAATIAPACGYYYTDLKKMECWYKCIHTESDLDEIDDLTSNCFLSATQTDLSTSSSYSADGSSESCGVPGCQCSSN